MSALDMRVIIVEDDEALGRWFEQILVSAGADVGTWTDAWVDLLDPYPWRRIDCAVVDLSPELGNGTGLLAYLEFAHPLIRRVLCASTAAHPSAHPHAVVLRPPTSQAVLDAVFGSAP